MDDYIYNLSLDLNCNKSMPSINSAQFDKNRKFAVSITANGEPFSVLGCQATLKCIHSDKSSSSLDCTDGISQTGTTVTVTLRENTLPVRGMTAAKLVFSDGTRNYSTQIFLIDVDSSLDGNIRAKEEFSVLNKLIDDVRDVIDNANNTMISGYESLTPDITFDIENSNVAGYLTNDDYTFTNDNAYNGADYASTNVPVTIDSTVNERPNGGDIAIPDGGVKLTLYDTVVNTKWSVNISGDTYTVKNLIPNRLYTYVITDIDDTVIKTGSCKASGQVRTIDAGKATTYYTTDPSTTFKRPIFNIRDLGGWACDGGRLKYGVIYRGCRLNGNYTSGQTRYGISISPAQIDFFKNFLGIRDEIDFRQVKDDPDLGNTETAGDDAEYETTDDIKDTALGIGVDYTIIPINPYLRGIEIKSDNAEMNRRYANVIKRIARDIKEGKPCYIHCLEGADRTATVVMIILAICGVSRNDIERDYELTSFSKDYAGNRNRRARNDTTQNYRWMNLMVYLLGNSFTGSSFRDKVIDYVLKIGVTIEEINTIRAGLIDGDPEKISSTYTDASVQYYLTNVIIDNPVSSIPMYQPFEATLTALNIQNVVVTMGGTDITLTVYSQGKISIPRVTGNIIVTATASGGVTSYEDLDDKPSINNVTLSGNKSSDDLRLQDKLTAGQNITINNGEISATDTTDYTQLSNLPKILYRKSTNIFVSGDLNGELKSQGGIYFTKSNGGYYIQVDPNKVFMVEHYDTFSLNSVEYNTKSFVLTANRFNDLPDFVTNRPLFAQYSANDPYFTGCVQFLYWRDSNGKLHTAQRINTQSTLGTWEEVKDTKVTSGVVNANGTITFTDSEGNSFTTSGASVIGADGFSPVATVTQTASGATVSITDKNGTTTANITNGQDGNDYVLTTQDKSDIADIVLSELPTTQGVLYGNQSN